MLLQSHFGIYDDRYLVQQTQEEQKKYAGLFAPLLRLLAHQFPHLCMTEDWLLSETNNATCATPIARKDATAVMKVSVILILHFLIECIALRY